MSATEPEATPRELEPPQPVVFDAAPPPSLGTGSAARLLAEGAGLVFGTLAAVITARWLGPDGKGVIATLTFMAALFGRAATLGLGEAGIVMVGRGTVSKQGAVSANLAAVIVSTVPAAALFAIVAVLQVGPDSTSLWVAVAVVAATVPAAAVQDIVGHALTIQERIVAASVVALATAGAIVLALLLLVIVLDLGIPGAAASSLAGIAVGLTLAGVLAGRNLRLLPRWSPAYLRKAVPYGLRLEVSYAVMFLAGRFDLLLVFSLIGAAAAGQFSVALTAASIAGLAPFAVSYAAFPRVAYADEPTAFALTRMAARRGLAASLLVALVLGGLSPVAVPFVFGSDFEPAVAPIFILLVGTLAGGVQWMLARAAASRGNPALLLRSFGLTLVSMIALDFALIPELELIGAAIASLTGNLLGLLVCTRHYSRHGLSARDLIPSGSDFKALWDLGVALAKARFGGAPVDE